MAAPAGQSKECVSIHKLVSENTCTAIRSRGNLTLIHAKLTGGNADQVAIASAGGLYARDLNVSGYQTAIGKYSYDRKARIWTKLDEYSDQR